MKEYSESSDEELLKEYHQEKNPYLLNLLFKRHADVGFRTAMRYMRNQPDAEDVLQLAFIHFLQNLHLTCEGSTNVKAWLMKVIVNISIDKLREEKRRSKRQESVASARFLENQNKMDATQMTDDKEHLKKKIKETVDTLPEKYRSPIWLILYEGFSYPEAATVLALPEKTVRTQVARGLERLRELMGSFGSILSVSLIVGLIAESKLEAAPATITKIIDSPNLYQKIGSNSQRVSLYSSKPAIPVISKIIIISLTIVASLTGLYYWNSSVKPTVIVSTSNRKPINLFFDFNTSKEKLPFAYSGGYQVNESGGLNKSGCLEMSSFFCMKIPIEIDQMPLKISYRYNPKFQFQNERADFDFSWGNWDQLNVFFMRPLLISYFKKANEYVYKNDSDWVDVTIWATKNCLDYWINGERARLYICSTNEPNKNFYLKFAHNVKIDNLSIVTVDNSTSPDISQFLKLNQEFTKEPQKVFKEIQTPIEKYFSLEKFPDFVPMHVTFKSCTESQNAEFFKNDSIDR